MESRKRIKQPIAGRWTRTSIIVLNSDESGVTTNEAVVMTAEEQTPVVIDNRSKNTEIHRFEYD